VVFWNFIITSTDLKRGNFTNLIYAFILVTSACVSSLTKIDFVLTKCENETTKFSNEPSTHVNNQKEFFSKMYSSLSKIDTDVIVSVRETLLDTCFCTHKTSGSRVLISNCHNPKLGHDDT